MARFDQYPTSGRVPVTKPPLKGTSSACTTNGGKPPVLINPMLRWKAAVKSAGGGVILPPILTPAIRVYGAVNTYVVAATTRTAASAGPTIFLTAIGFSLLL